MGNCTRKSSVNHGLLNRVVEYYLLSHDFNGLPLSEIDGYDSNEMRQLIMSGYVEAIFDDENPHIKRFNREASIDEQLKHIQKGHKTTCFYPTALALSAISKDETRPYTKLLQSGWGQYEVIYFEVEVLEQYFNDPRYRIVDYGYRGMLSVRDEYESGDYIKDYGMSYPAGYKQGDPIDRAVAVFVHDLARLSSKAQMKWKSRECDKQSEWHVNRGFIRDLVLGEWEDESYWVFSELLNEQSIINEICRAIGIEDIFLNTWDSYNYEQFPEGYRIILVPTKKNYYDFVVTLEKMICENLNCKAFTNPQKHTKNVMRDEEGSIALLGKWLKANTHHPDMVDNEIIAVLKKLRKQRQKPAHVIERNVYDKKVYSDQNQLIADVYYAVHSLRTILATHPLAKSVKIQEETCIDRKIAIF